MRTAESKYDILDDILHIKSLNIKKNEKISVDNLVNFNKFLMVCVNPLVDYHRICLETLLIVPFYYTKNEKIPTKSLI